MREVVLGSLLFVIVLAVALPSAFASRADTVAPTPSASHSLSTSGPGFTICSADGSWRRPTDQQQQAHLDSDHRFTGTWETPDTTGYREFHAPAVLYDGTSASGMSWLVNFSGLWNVWDDPVTRPKTCWSEQPQVFLFGYEPVGYDAQDPSVAVLRVRPAPGYAIAVLTGPIRSQIAIVADRRLDQLVVPDAWVTPVH